MRGYFGIGLVNPKNAENYGGALRAAACYDASFMVLQGKRFQNHCTNTSRAEKHIPLFEGEVLEFRTHDCQLVVIELVEGAKSLPSFQHPIRAYYVFGPEDGSVPKEIISKAQHVVSIPTRNCMNLAATVNVVLYDRIAKAERYARGIRNDSLGFNLTKEI